TANRLDTAGCRALFLALQTDTMTEYFRTHRGYTAVSGAWFSAACEPALSRRAGLVRQLVVREHRGLVGRGQLAVGVDAGRVGDLLLVVAHPDRARRHGRAVERDEHQAVPAHDAHLDRGEGGLVGGGVDVDGLEVTDLGAGRVDDLLATPV